MATPIQTNPTNNEIFGHYPRNLRPLSTGAHAVVEDGPRGGGLQAGDSVLRLHEDYVRELPPRHDIESANVRLFF